MVVREFKQRTNELLAEVMDFVDVNGHTPLHIASYFGDFKTSRLFTMKGANPLFETANGKETCLAVGKDKYSRGVIQTLNDAANTSNTKDL